MPNLLECLLHGHKDTNNEAVKLYEKAQKNLNAKESQGEMGGDEMSDEMERLIIEDQLTKVNLLDPEMYGDLRDKIENWYVPFAGNEDIAGFIAPVQRVLLSRLEHFRELQQQNPPDECATLLASCKEYREHLWEIVNKETMQPQLPSRGGYAPLESKTIKKAQQQIDAIELLIGELQSKNDSNTKLQKFQEIYKANKKIIESGHDSAAVKFKKILDSILLVLKGKAKHVSELWKTKGKELTDHVQTATKPYKKL